MGLLAHGIGNNTYKGVGSEGLGRSKDKYGAAKSESSLDPTGSTIPEMAL